jgi:tRNA A37 threonylcarbamoyladenosine synthetase subunit TsaC/SUA5/YrdC
MIYILPTDTCYGIACAFDEKKDYERIYKMKKRSLNKPLAIMVESFDWLKENTTLSLEQIDFLKQYKKPFTILTNSDAIELYLNFQDESEDYYVNKDVYSEIAFRVANNKIEEKLIKRV